MPLEAFVHNRILRYPNSKSLLLLNLRNQNQIKNTSKGIGIHVMIMTEMNLFGKIKMNVHRANFRLAQFSRALKTCTIGMYA